MIQSEISRACIGHKCFTKNMKLKTDEISSVFNLKCLINGEYFRFIFKPNQLAAARLATIVSKKIIRHAVRRNYCKRVSRELFRLRQNQLLGFDLVIQVKKGFSSLQFDIVANEFDYLLSKLILRR